VTNPSEEMQTKLLEEIYSECGISGGQISYIEAHGTGTKVGDPVELNALTAVLCREKRERPLLIGSVKSNMGHSEPASGEKIESLLPYKNDNSDSDFICAFSDRFVRSCESFVGDAKRGNSRESSFQLSESEYSRTSRWSNASCIEKYGLERRTRGHFIFWIRRGKCSCEEFFVIFSGKFW